MYCLYILYSASSNLYYVGRTDNYARRLVEHNTSERVTNTSKHRPWKLMAVYCCGAERSEALKIERHVKKQKSKSFIERLVQEDVHSGLLAQLIRVPIVRD